MEASLILSTYEWHMVSHSRARGPHFLWVLFWTLGSVSNSKQDMQTSREFISMCNLRAHESKRSVCMRARVGHQRPQYGWKPCSALYGNTPLLHVGALSCEKMRMSQTNARSNHFRVTGSCATKRQECSVTIRQDIPHRHWL